MRILKSQWINFFLALFCLIVISSWLIINSAIEVVLDTRLFALVSSAMLLAMTSFAWYQTRNNLLFTIFIITITIFMMMVYEICFRYNESKVVFQNKEISLSGLYYEPKFKDRFPLVVVLHGSGVGRKEEYAFYARMLAKNGIACLAYDKRGCGESSGELYSVGYEGYAADASAAIDFLKTTRKYSYIGIFGISEGEWVAPLVNSYRNDIDFMILQSACGVSPIDQVVEEVSYRLTRKGFKDAEIQIAASLYRTILNYDGNKRVKDSLEAVLARSREEDWFIAAEKIPAEVHKYEWWPSVKDFRPEAYFKLSVRPLLVVLGDRNESYPPGKSIKNFERLGANVVVLPKGDHNLLNWWLGSKTPPPVFAKGYPDIVPDWINKHFD